MGANERQKGLEYFKKRGGGRAETGEISGRALTWLGILIDGGLCVYRLFMN